MLLKEKLNMILKLFLEILCIHLHHLHLQNFVHLHLHHLLLPYNLLYLNLKNFLHKIHIKSLGL
tara:strand:- start:3 stop:194 length:192 start_codon:yes stop_codon:yes gene_type:complete